MRFDPAGLLRRSLGFLLRSDLPRSDLSSRVASPRIAESLSFHRASRWDSRATQRGRQVGETRGHSTCNGGGDQGDTPLATGVGKTGGHSTLFFSRGKDGGTLHFVL